MKMSRCIEICIILLLFDTTVDLAKSWKFCPLAKRTDLKERYPVLEYWAQDKANLRSPRTQYEFYDFVRIQKYGIPHRKSDAQFKNACQVVIAHSQPINVINTTGPQIKQKTTDCIYQNRIHHSGRIVFKTYTLAGNQWGLNRKQVSQVGCGYTSRLNKSHYIDHLVCPWCASFGLEVKQTALPYQEIRSPLCGNCNRYQTEYRWRCVKRCKHLCFAQENQKNKRNNSLIDNSIASWKPQAAELINFEKITQHRTQNDDFVANIKTTTDELPKQNSDEDEIWSLPEEIYVENQFSYRDKEDLNCNLCKYVVIFAACSTGVVVIMAAYVFYAIKYYQKQKSVTAWK